MYKLFIRPFLFLFDPEKVHHFTFGMLRFFFSIPGKVWVFSKIYGVNNPKLERELFGLKFKNPVGMAAGFDKNAVLFHRLHAFGFGFVEIGTVTPMAQAGNPTKRLFRLKKDRALINRMGFNNDGAIVIADRLKKGNKNLIVGGNIGKNTATPNEKAKEDYRYNLEKLHPVVDYFVVNVSCPNVGNIALLQEKQYLIPMLKELRELNASLGKEKPILLKIGPDRTEQQLDEVIEVIAESGIAGVICTNTATDRSNLKTDSKRLEKIGNGGLSGKPLSKKSTEIIRYLSSKSNKAFPIIGVGGIHSAEDAMEKIKAGADLVQVYTGFIYEGPGLVKRINKKIIKDA
jgi:dihydroorotate dehydrogenase